MPSCSTMSATPSFPISEGRASCRSPQACVSRWAFDEAEIALRDFEAFRQRTLADERLSPAGKQQALREWAESHLTKLRQRAAEVADEGATNETRVLRSITETLFGDAPSDNASDAMLARKSAVMSAALNRLSVPANCANLQSRIGQCSVPR
jgi:hypothetical protein